MDVFSTARERLYAVPSISLGQLPTPVDEAPRLRDAIGMGARLLIKRDDALSFGFGGNKVRKLALVVAEALAHDADTLVTCGGAQSNHCRATAAAAARCGLACHLVLNGEEPETRTGNLRLDTLFGAEVTWVAERGDRAPAMERLAESLRSGGRRPWVIPLGASTPLGALGLARAVGELLQQARAPDIILCATSSGGTQAGLLAGCALHGLQASVIGISADDPPDAIRAKVLGITAGIEERLGLAPGALGTAARFQADNAFVGGGYGVETDASREAQELAARTEALVTDRWYTAKALAGLVARGRRGEFPDGGTVLFWHTGGQVGLFA